MAKFKIGNYQGIKIDCWTAKDLVGLHHLMKQEGCPNSENLFSDTDKAIELDDVQRRISQKHHADKKSSADMLLHVNDKTSLSYLSSWSVRCVPTSSAVLALCV